MKRASGDNTLLSNGIEIDGVFYPKKNLPSGTLRIILTTACNYKCIYCFNEGEANKEVRVQSIDRLKKIIHVAREFGINSIKLTGGEPLLYPNVEELLDFMQREDIGYYDFTTNISLLTENKIDMLNKYNVSSLTLSLNTLEKNKYNYLSGTNNYNLVMYNLQNVLKKFNGKIRINCIVFDENYNKEDYFNILKLCKTNNIGLRFVEPSKVDGYPITYTKEKFNELLSELRDESNKIILSDCKSVEYLFFDEWYLTVMHSLCDNKICEACKDYMYLRLTSDDKLKPCLKRRDTEIELDYLDDIEIKKGFVKAISYMGRGINE